MSIANESTLDPFFTVTTPQTGELTFETTEQLNRWIETEWTFWRWAIDDGNCVDNVRSSLRSRLDALKQSAAEAINYRGTDFATERKNI